FVKKQRYELTRRDVKLVEDYHNSGKSQKLFCLDHELKPSTFSYWIRKKRMMDTPEDGFVKIETTALSHAGLEVIFPNGVKVKDSKSDLAFITQLIRVY